MRRAGLAFYDPNERLWTSYGSPTLYCLLDDERMADDNDWTDDIEKARYNRDYREALKEAI